MHSVNLNGLTAVDSSAIGELVAAYTGIRRDGGEMKLLDVGKRTRDLITTTRLHMVFEVFDDEAEAIASFSAAPVAAAGSSSGAN